MPKNPPVWASAPDFELTSVSGERIHLAEILKEKNVVLVMMRGFA